MASSPNLVAFAGGYDELVRNVGEAEGLVVVNFSAVWCPPCKRLDEHLAAVAVEMPNVLFLKVDVDQSRDIANHYQINSIPHVRFIRTGPDGVVQELGTVTGEDFPQIKSKIQQLR